MIAISDKQGYFEILTPQFHRYTPVLHQLGTLFRKLLHNYGKIHHFAAGKTHYINNGSLPYTLNIS